MSESVQTVSFWRGKLPHWEVVDGRYFVTLRQSGTLPKPAEEELRTLLNDATEKDYLARSRLYFKRLEALLDRCYPSDGGLCAAGVAQAIANTVSVYEERGYWHMTAYTVMPSHLHLFFRCGTRGLKAVMERFKRATARFAAGRRAMPLWQEEWFDHWSRSAQEDDKIVSYIRNNPVRAELAAGPEDWPWTRVK